MMPMKRFRPYMLASLLAMLLPATLWAQRDFVQKTTDPLCLLPSATSLALTLVKHDTEGFRQLAYSSALAIGVEYVLELSIKEKRPDGTGDHAFPSTHTMAAFSGASFLQRRYGWRWGVPAYAVSTYVAWGRVYSRRHNVWDVLAGAGVGIGSTYVFTRPYLKDKEITIAPAVVDNGQGLYFSMRF